MPADRSPPEVVVAGYAGIDTIARIRETVQPGFTGIIERFPDRPAYGGCAPNVAVGLARLGIRSAVAMVVGDDPEGHDYVAYLDKEGVDTRRVVMVPGGRTPRTYLFVPPQGPTSLFFDRGAAADWDESVEGMLEGARLAVLTVGPRAHSRRFGQAAIEARIPLAWQMKGDVQAYPPDSLLELLKGSRYVFMNHQEGEYLRGALGLSSLEALGTLGPEVICVTKGAAGSLVLAGKRVSEVPAVSSTVADTTGAGDGFTTGALAGILRGWTALDAARLGSVVASFVVEALGAQVGLPAWEAAQARYQGHFGEPPRQK